MNEELILGIDCGGTHTDAALLAFDASTQECRLLAHAKTVTRHDNLPASIASAARALGDAAQALFPRVKRITLGTTLEINALIQGKADKVGLALSAGPGLDPVHFVLGDYFCIVPGGLDHRGVEVEKLYLDVLKKEVSNWGHSDVHAIACVGKFSPRNALHEEQMGQIAKTSGLPVTLGHKLSGSLNFPRRIATAYYNAAVERLHREFLKAVQDALHELKFNAQLNLLKADGGAIPFSVSEKEPVQSILSGPAASVMGALALWQGASGGCSLLLDMGGTTTDIALFLEGSPVVDRRGMLLEGRRTLVKSLASVSVGVGGDSMLGLAKDSQGNSTVSVGPRREGPALAFGGNQPTLLDALNMLDPERGAGDVAASEAGLQKMAQESDMADVKTVAKNATENAMQKIASATYELIENINASPVYTLAGLKAAKEARPVKACVVGGPAESVRKHLEKALGISVEIGPLPGVTNAIGAAVSQPTASLEVYADTTRGMLHAPALDYEERIPRKYEIGQACEKARNLLAQTLEQSGIPKPNIEIVEADMFATLDDAGHGGRDMRVVCQVRPGIIGKVKSA